MSLESRNENLKNLVAPSGPSFRNKLKILIVDDNMVIRKILKGYLTKLGVEAQEAVNGKDAVDIIYNGAEFNLILMDKDMPIMDGPEATRKLRSMGINVRIVGVSGNSRDKEIQDFMEAGINEYYVKPITFSQLTSLLQEIDNSL